ncbi:DUF3833 domain-containing protein [Hirschia baltica]|uniref:Lipoprotein n=1 Tax=Hirschia baltica (strain ATCC 49814 / DSM 5838 / IFAM 1418) TaxID=582402 RepID=C6XIR6_HIRBI|nr:DUF3833 domain-containing protein [Hirschia baltica]ACT59011.1 conserved hypothetical protein [Hirschia baltica ATCC 49814]
MTYFSTIVFIIVSLFLLSGCVWGFSHQKPADYAEATPLFDPKTTLKGDYLSEGLIYDYTGKVVSRFKARMSGNFDENGGTLAEHFIYASGREDRREWTLKFKEDGGFTATAPDLVGEGVGIASGNSLQMKYKLKLAEDAGGHVLSVTDWMYLTDEGTIINRSQMRKFGIKVAELVAVFKHRDIAEDSVFYNKGDNNLEAAE